MLVFAMICGLVLGVVLGVSGMVLLGIALSIQTTRHP